MSRCLDIHRCGPGLSLQDRGRPGYLAFGLSRGGAADRIALAEGAALLGQSPELAALEMPGMGGVFEAQCDMRIALTGAPMPARVDGSTLAWNASHLLPAGARLEIGAASAGVYGYLHVGGGFDAPSLLGARSAHLGAGLGRALAAGDSLPVGQDSGGAVGLTLRPLPRLGGGLLRVVAGHQTALFGAQNVERFSSEPFTRGTRANRMGVQLKPSGPGFQVLGGLSVVSEAVTPGDIQVTGDGAPYVLLSECQTTGGYPRLGTVLPADLPRAAQTRAGEAVRFDFVSLDAAVDIQRRHLRDLAMLPRAVTALVRDPHDIPDLLSYQLISGVVAGHEPIEEDTA